MKLNEVRKEDDIYYSGPFWIIADSRRDLMKGNFKLLTKKIPTNFEGDKLENVSKKELTHKDVWSDLGDGEHSYTFYPRGRVGIYKGHVYINMNDFCNTPKIVDSIVNEYCLNKFSWDDIDLEFDNLDQGNHYDFELE